MWFYDFLEAHQKLLKLQLDQHVRVMIRDVDYELKCATNMKIYNEKTGRNKKPTPQQVEQRVNEVNRTIYQTNRIMRLYESDVESICLKPLDQFLYALESDGFIDKMKWGSIEYAKPVYRRKKKYRYETAQHLGEYIYEHYVFIRKTLEDSKGKVGLDKTSDIVIAFDAMTDTLHRGWPACIQLARMYPIRGDVVRDAYVINTAVKYSLMDGEVSDAINRVNEYLSDRYVPKQYTPYTIGRLPPEFEEPEEKY